MNELKTELSKLELSIWGNKAELQKMLIYELKRRDIDSGIYEFEYKEEMEGSLYPYNNKQQGFKHNVCCYDEKIQRIKREISRNF